MPTPEDLRATHRQPGHIKLHGSAIEYRYIRRGSNAGVPATCLDFHFCNLECADCPDKSIWDKSNKFYNNVVDLPLEEFHKRLRKVQQNAGISPRYHEYYAYMTGGEPLIQQQEIVNLLEAFPRYSIGIKTNGTSMLHPEMIRFADRIHIDCVPRLPKSEETPDRFYKETVLQQLAGLPATTFVVELTDKKDLEYYKKAYYQLLPVQSTMIYAPTDLESDILKLHVPCIFV